MYDPLLVSRGTVDRSEPNLSPATDISMIPLRWTAYTQAYTQGQPIAGLSHRDQTISAEKVPRTNPIQTSTIFNPWI